ncbi:MAG: hypothetical protein QW304_07625 [Thermoproteota archaeon]
MKCPSCGAELPSPSHFGMKASPKNYILPQIILTPGKKYNRTFSILFYPARDDPELGHLESCIVIASEEYPKEDLKAAPFIAGAKFYPEDISKLAIASKYVLLSHVVFTSYISGKDVGAILNARLRELYYSPEIREDLKLTAQSMMNKMKLCADITQKEENSKR